MFYCNNGHFSKAIRQREMLRSHNKCRHCSTEISEDWREGVAFNFDHIIPRALGGTNQQSNCQILCVACHKKKTVQDLADIRCSHEKIAKNFGFFRSASKLTLSARVRAFQEANGCCQAAHEGERCCRRIVPGMRDGRDYAFITKPRKYGTGQMTKLFCEACARDQGADLASARDDFKAKQRSHWPKGRKIRSSAFPKPRSRNSVADRSGVHPKW